MHDARCLAVVDGPISFVDVSMPVDRHSPIADLR
jgi:hypothetical protein